MKYVFDNNTLSAIFKHYFYDRFPSFWEKFNELIESREIVSVREVRREIEFLKRDDNLDIWLKTHTDFFEEPSVNELEFITKIFSIPHFQQNLERKKLLKGGPYADPFIIAKTKINNAIVVSEEKLKENAVRIPNICKYFDIEYINLEGFLTKENWKF